MSLTNTPLCSFYSRTFSAIAVYSWRIRRRKAVCVHIYRYAPSLRITYIRISCALLADGAESFQLSGRFTPSAAHRRVDKTSSEICLSAKLRDEWRFCKACIRVTLFYSDGFGNRILSCAITDADANSMR